MTGSNPGELSHRLTFKRRERQSGTRGVKVGDFVKQFDLWGHVRLLRGGEEVLGARLGGVQPAIITVKASPLSDQIMSGWIIEHKGAVWNVKEPPRRSQNRMYYEMLVSRGQGDA